jgi:cholesterol oxidase
MAQDATAGARPSEPGGSFDVVVIGSGFGGSVMAFQLAKAGYSVCVLERGRAYPPGTFPRTPKQMGQNFWDPSEDRFGLFDIWSFRKMEAIVASGLGGGSLIYANVLLRKDENWFLQDGGQDQAYERWPLTRGDLDPHYDNVEAVLAPTEYPYAAETPKTRAFALAGRALSNPAEPAPLAVTFANQGANPVPGELIQEPPNLHGARGVRYTCRLTGECDIGCNWGSKNTLDFNYLTMAHKAGAEIRTRCEVEDFFPQRGRGKNGWCVTYLDRTGADEDPSKPEHWRRSAVERRVEARAVVLAAGCFGSTFLMLKMRDRLGWLPDLSPMAGRRFSGNGDALSFAARCRDWQDDKLVAKTIDATYGPVITSFMRYEDGLDEDSRDPEKRGFYLEDGGFPNLAAWAVEVANTPGVVRRAAAVAARMLVQRITGSAKSTLDSEAWRLLGDAEYSGGTLPILAMGRDYPVGTMRLSGKGMLELDADGGRSEKYYDKVRRMSSYLSDALQARDFKISLSWYLRRMLTVHPLGGLPMADRAEDGVVNAYGEVFNYKNLYVADASVMPGPVGANPSLTIAALGDRFAQRVIENLGAPSPPDTLPPETARTRILSAGVPPDDVGELDPDEPPKGLSFKEEMHGFITLGDSDDYEEGFRRGKLDGNAISFTLVIEIPNMANFYRDPDQTERAQGHIDSTLFGRALIVPDGRFNLFKKVGNPPRKQMEYELPFEAGGNQFVLSGHKNIHDDPGFDPWVDLTRLFTRIVDRDPPPNQQPKTVAYGIVEISPHGFLDQLLTFRSDDGLPGLARFGKFFFGNLVETYWPHLLGPREEV